MSVTLQWQARMFDRSGTPIADLPVEVQIFIMERNAWSSISSARTAADGSVQGKARLEDETLVYAPALRLVEPRQGQLALHSSSPAFSRSEGGKVLVANFGDITRLDEPAQARTTSGLGSRIPDVGISFYDNISLGGVTLDPAASLAKTLAEPVRINEFTSSLANEMITAQSTIKSQGFVLSKATLKTKVLLEEGGTVLRLPMHGIEATDPLSELELGFQKGGAGTAAVEASAGGVAIPDVRQLTEGAARRVLASVGLVLETSFGPAAPGTALAEGQAMLQSPAAGGAVPRGSSVLVLFVRDPPPDLQE